MDLQPMDREGAVLVELKTGGTISIETALLVISGLKTDSEIRTYQHKIDVIWARFQSKYGHGNSPDPSAPPPYLHQIIAKYLFEYLWLSKPKRFGDYFLLTDVIDAQLNPDVHRVVGNCVGLTSLYSVLALRAGLHLSVLLGLDHLLSRLRLGQQVIDMDHTDPQGFDCRNREGFREVPLPILTASVLNSRGLRNEAGGQFEVARADYQKAILVNPEYANAFNNRGNMSFRDEDFEGAIADYTEAIRLHPGFCEAYCHRGMARHRLGRFNEARQDYHRALRANSEHSDARRCLQQLDHIELREPSECLGILSQRRDADGEELQGNGVTPPPTCQV